MCAVLFLFVWIGIEQNNPELDRMLFLRRKFGGMGGARKGLYSNPIEGIVIDKKEKKGKET